MTVQSSPPGSHILSNTRTNGKSAHSLLPVGDTGRLVVVSNRVADLSSSTQTGGLAVGLADAINEQGGLWFGWDGSREGKTGGPLKISQHGAVTSVGVPISPDDFTDYYLGFSNSVLWPLFHYRLDLVHITAKAFDGYMRVNEVFARQLMPLLRPDDQIWIHDYHLIPLASMLRKLGCTQKIGHFLHIPFPAPELLAATPHHRELVDALLDYDLLGFQTHTDAGNLKSYLTSQRPDVNVKKDHVLTADNTVRLGRFPIGIDVAEFGALARKPDVGSALLRNAPSPNRRKRIIGVDRLDYSKGLPERFRAFDEFLQRYPQFTKQVGFVQVAPPSRGEVDAYADIRNELEQLAGSINGRFGELDWTPVQYICRALPRDTLAPLMRQSEVGFVTPLRDGMNLVAKEYVAAQDPEDPGVLILSQFAGAAEEMRQALIVNPYDPEDMAQQLHRALSMPLQERRARHAALLSHITEYDAKSWAAAFLSALKGPSSHEACLPVESLAPAEAS